MLKIQTDTKEKAAEFWRTNGFAAIPTSLVQRAFKDTAEELEFLAGGAEVSDCCDGYVNSDGNCEGCGEACDTHPRGAYYGWPAAHGWMYHPRESLDEAWIRDNLEAVAACGFLVYDSDETGILLAIDGGGYNFNDRHWIPLYEARGLEWHLSD